MRVVVAVLSLWCALVVALFVIAADVRVAVMVGLMSLWGALMMALVVVALAMIGVVDLQRWSPSRLLRAVSYRWAQSLRRRRGR